jgi:hypothetical protein
MVSLQCTHKDKSVQSHEVRLSASNTEKLEKGKIIGIKIGQIGEIEETDKVNTSVKDKTNKRGVNEDGEYTEESNKRNKKRKVTK